jgi:hypothetical protein
MCCGFYIAIKFILPFLWHQLISIGLPLMTSDIVSDTRRIGVPFAHLPFSFLFFFFSCLFLFARLPSNNALVTTPWLSRTLKLFRQYPSSLSLSLSPSLSCGDARLYSSLPPLGFSFCAFFFFSFNLAQVSLSNLLRHPFSAAPSFFSLLLSLSPPPPSL